MPSDIDRLIALGLNRYGAGDLEGALLMWEEALAIDPDNLQAASYVDYVRLNFEMLSSDPEVVPADEAPFGIEEEPEYHIEITEGELVRPDSEPMVPETIDAGWFDDEATHDLNDLVQREAPPPVELELELEVEAPPPPPEVNFEDATREYYGTPTLPAPPVAVARTETGDNDFSETAGTSEFQSDQFTGGFQPEGTPVGFGNQETEIRKRDLGFVQPTAVPQPTTDKPSSPLTIGSAPTMDTISLGELMQAENTSPGERTLERRPSYAAEDDAAEDDASDETPDERDLLEGLPVPNRAQQSVIDAETQDIPLLSSKAVTKELPDGGRLPSSKAITKELPDSKRPPARRDSADLSQAENVLQAAPTRDFGMNPAARIDIGAPTRELGIRPPSKRPGTLPNPVDEDAPTKQSDVRAIRETARDQGRAQSFGETTKDDIKPTFDPIEARAAEILDEVDAGAPEGEAHDEQTRRRIGSLLEKAVLWNQSGDTERAVAAVDLALNEDPNSALGQKLITRNRDTIMQVFQGYLGDLDRQPQLAKPLHELQNAPISPRAAFLLSRIDGTLTIDELLDVSGMPRLEAYRHLCQLFLRGILR